MLRVGSLAAAVGSAYLAAVKTVGWGAIARWLSGWNALGGLLRLVFGGLLNPDGAEAETTTQARRLGLDKKTTAALVKQQQGIVPQLEGIGARIVSTIVSGITRALSAAGVAIANAFIGAINWAIRHIPGVGSHLPTGCRARYPCSASTMRW